MTPWDDLIERAGLSGRVKLIRRDEVQAGDEILSSHYGRRTVKSVTRHGSEGQTTEIIFESPAGSRTLNEIYGSAQTVPKILPDALIVTTRHARCDACNSLVDATLVMARVIGTGEVAYTAAGHGVTVEHETYAQRRAALSAGD